MKHFAEKLANLSADIIRRDFHSGQFQLDTKNDGTPVTSTDLAAEKVMREAIEKQYPTHGIIGEEFGNVRTDADYVWLLDPIDGTKSYLHGVPLFGTLIGLLYKGVPVVGLIHQPILDIMVIGDGAETTCNHKPVSVRSTQDPEDATLLCTNPADPFFLSRGAAWDEFTSRCSVVRSWGDCFGYLLLVTGKADIMIDPVLSPWDLLPLLPILKGAGATVTDLAGQDPAQGTSLVATVPALHDAVLHALA